MNQNNVCMVYPFNPAWDCIKFWKNESPFVHEDPFPFFDKSGKMFLIKISSRAWRNLRIFESENFKCKCCLRETKTLGIRKNENGFYTIIPYVGPISSKNILTIDHIRPKHKKGVNAKENIQPLCQRCNSKKGSKIITIPELRKLLKHELPKHLSNPEEFWAPLSYASMS